MLASILYDRLVELAAAGGLVVGFEDSDLIEEGIGAWITRGEANDGDGETGVLRLASRIYSSFEFISDQFDCGLANVDFSIDPFQVVVDQAELCIELTEFDSDLAAAAFKIADLPGAGLAVRR